MATLKFFIKGKRSINTIYLRLVHGRREVDLVKSTSLIINQLYWNNEKGKVRQIAEYKDKVNLQNNLNDLKIDILNNFNTDYANGIFINRDWLNDQILNSFNREQKNDLNNLINYFGYYIKEKQKDAKDEGERGFNNRTILKYNGTIKKIKEFEQKQRKRYRIIEVNLKFRRDFIYFLRETQKLNNNTIGKYLSNIKAVCNHAKSEKIKIDQELNSAKFKIPKSKTSFIYLDKSEINKIYDYDFKDRPYLNNARNWLIIGVWTGARASDLLYLSTKNIHNNYIEYTSQKTNQNIIVGIHYQITNIINEYSFPKRISVQKYNEYIKEVCEIVGIDEEVQGSKIVNITPKSKKKTFRKVFDTYKKYQLVSTHIGRRSFANNHYGKLPTPVLMNITGHTAERMFLTYINKSPKDSADTLNEYWKKVKKEGKNKNDSKIIKLKQG